MYIHTDHNAIILAKCVDSCSCPLEIIAGILHSLFAATKCVLVYVHVLLLSYYHFFSEITVFSCHYLEGKFKTLDHAKTVKRVTGISNGEHGMCAHRSPAFKSHSRSPRLKRREVR